MNGPGTLVTVEIETLAHGGDGLGRVDGRVCFVPFALPGDRVLGRVNRRTPSAWWATLLKVERPSPDRVPCLGGAAGRAERAYLWGCLAYPAQSDWKRRIAADCLARIAKITPELRLVEDPSLRLGYRTRAEFHGDGEDLGYYAHRTHDILPMRRCPLCHDRVNEMLAELAPLKVRGSVTVTVHPETGEALLWASPATGPRLAGHFQNVNWPGDGRPRARFDMDGVPVVNGTFCQSGLLLNRLLVREVRAMAGGCRSLLDLYCGNGNLSLAMAREGVRVTGMDHAGEAVDAARAAGAGDYLRGGEEAMARAVAAGGHRVILLDPPRTGAVALTPALAAADAARIVYVSCDPATLARDLRALAAGGWRVADAAVLDLFPHTPHLETVCLLQRD